jgi:hypothetical protein
MKSNTSALFANGRLKNPLDDNGWDDFPSYVNKIFGFRIIQSDLLEAGDFLGFPILNEKSDRGDS